MFSIVDEVLLQFVLGGVVGPNKVDQNLEKKPSTCPGERRKVGKMETL